MKLIVLSTAALLVVVTTKAQSFTENFSTATNASLTTGCWVLNGASVTTQNGEIINGASILTAPAPNSNAKVDLYTPNLDITGTSVSVNFDYKLTQGLGGNANRLIQVALVSASGAVVGANSVTLDGSTPTTVLHYVYTFSPVVPGVYRTVIRISGTTGNGNVRIVLDNLNISNSTLYNPGVCAFTPLIESTLPVKLKSFTAQLGDNKVNLKWITSTEINASHFVIQRSYNGTDFSDIATVMAAGNSSTENTYSYTDNTVSFMSQVAYYRLHQVDIDGKADYSSTRIIRNSKQDPTTVTILSFPNPVTNELRITIPDSWQNKKATYEVININGQVARKMETGSSSQTETINVSNMAPGFYIVRVSCEGQTAQQKIVKQ